jgi:small-conductance mechanosensitive channel
MREILEAHPTLKTFLIVMGILFVTGVAAKALSVLLNKLLKKMAEKNAKAGSKVSHKMLVKFLIAVIYVLGIITAVNQIPRLAGTLTTILAGSGVLAVIIGFAAQESFGNLISGIFLTLFKPFEAGDRITLPEKDITGYVEDITLRHTVIRTLSYTRALIPNAIMGSAIVENVDYVDGSPAQVPIKVDVAYDTDLERAVAVMGEALSAHPLYAGSKPPRVIVTGFGSSGISLLGLLPIQDAAQFTTAASDARILVKKAFDQNGIVIPYQTITISNRAPGDDIRIYTTKDS